MALQIPAQFNQLNAPAIDQAIQQKEWNTLRQQGEQQRQGMQKQQFDYATQLENSKWLAAAAKQALDMDPQSARRLWPQFVQTGQSKGIWQELPINVDQMSDEEFMQGWKDMYDDQMMVLAGQPQEKVTYGQPVAGVDESGKNILLRPSSTGELRPTGYGAPDKAPLVSVTNEAEKEGLTAEQKALANQRVTEFGKINEEAMAATGTMETIDQMRNIDFEGGPGTDFKNQARRFVMAMGGDALVNVDEVNNAASFTGLAYREFLNIMAAQSGPQTDNDFLRIKETFATVTDPKIAREFLMDSAYATASRKKEMSMFYENYLEDNNGSLKGANKAWDNYKRTTPLLSDSVKDPSTGLPTFYIDFKERMSIVNPTATEEQILQKWRELTQGK